MDFPTHHITQSAEETQKIGEALGIAYLKEKVSRSEIPLRGRSMGLPHVILCTGDLGSGKTTFIRGIARGLGIDTRLLSPTYIIVRRYSIPRLSPESFLYHLDLYRTKGLSDAEGVGIFEMLDDINSITVIEWPERMGTVLLPPHIDCQFRVFEENKHEVTIQRKPTTNRRHGVDLL